MKHICSQQYHGNMKTLFDLNVDPVLPRGTTGFGKAITSKPFYVFPFVCSVAPNNCKIKGTRHLIEGWAILPRSEVNFLQYPDSSKS